MVICAAICVPGYDALKNFVNWDMKCIILTLAVTSVCYSGRAQTAHVPALKAQQLNDEAVTKYIKYGTNTDSIKAALRLLGQAVVADSGYYNAWTNKLDFECQAGLYESALKTTNSMVRLFPAEVNVLFLNGVLQFKTGHSKDGIAVFNKLLKLYDAMPAGRENADNLKTIQINKGIALILVGRKKEGEDILTQLGSKEKDPAVKHYLMAYIGKPKAAIVTELIPGK